MDVRVENTTNLIDSLASDLQQVQVVGHPLKQVLPWFVLAVLYVTFAVAVLGARADIAERMFQSVYLFEIGLVLAMSVSAAFCSIWLCIPDMRGQRWMLALPVSFFGALLVWLGLRFGLDFSHMPHLEWHQCINEALVFGVIPVISLSYLTSRGKTTQPNVLSFMNALAIGGLGYIGLRITCPSEDIAHILLFHFLPYVFIGLGVWASGRKIYRW